MDNKTRDTILANMSKERKDAEAKRDEAIKKIAEIDEVVAMLNGQPTQSVNEVAKALSPVERILIGQVDDIARLVTGGEDDVFKPAP